MLRRMRSLLADRDSGSVLIVTMMIIMLAGGLTIVVLTSSMATNHDSGVDRQRTIAVDAAESGIDASYAEIQSSALNLPCTWPATGTNDVNAYPDPTQVKATITYYDVNHTALACPLAASAVPTTALIKSTATTPALGGSTDKGVRTMEAYVNLVPIYGNGFNNAIFGNTTILASNKATVNQNSDGTTADLYSNGNVICQNNENFQGSIFAPKGSILFDTGCSASVSGDLWARDSVTTKSNPSIIGRVISSGSTVALSGPTSVGQTVIAASTITWSGCDSTKNNCLQNMASAAPPSRSQPFPVIKGDSATTDQWVANGYQYKTPSSCANVVSDIKTYAQGTTKTLYEVPATCGPVAFSNDKVTFNSNFALFAYGGISTANNTSFIFGSQAVSNPLNVYMIVPYDAATPTCTSPGITTNNQFSVDSTINILWYSPCNVTLSQNSKTDMHGQIYSGSTVTTGQNMSMTFVNTNPIGVAPDSLPTLSYRVDILYKRETHS